MNVVREGRCKGSFVKALSIEKELQPYCDEQFHLLCELNIYGIAVMYSEEGLITWIRSNGLYADIHAGASNDALLDTLTEKLANISWK
ncbi:MAG: hypothetical protein E7559_08470 [Ruminococcaceae bacterium]|nr:hypothetical protein [Oscillospiraceae bacterium]